MSEETKTARDGKRGCPVTVWDGPYSTRCGAGASVGKCAHHGPFVTTAPELTEAARREAWDEALKHAWELNDPAYTVAQSHQGVLTATDIGQAQRENPYTLLAESERDEEGGR